MSGGGFLGSGDTFPVYALKVLALIGAFLVPLLGIGFLNGFVFDTLGPALAGRDDRAVLGAVAGVVTAAPYLVLLALPRTARWVRGALWVLALSLLFDLFVLTLSSGGRTELGQENLAGWQEQAGAFDVVALLVHLLVAVPLWRRLYRGWDAWNRTGSQRAR